MSEKKIAKVCAFILIIIIIAILNWKYNWADYLSNTENLMFIKKIIEEKYFLAVLIYIAITIVGCVVLALPGITFAILSGLLFGPFMGIITCLLATTIGAMVAFLVGRFFLKDSIKPMIEKNKLIKKVLFSSDGKSDMILLMITRMIPIFPYNLQNYAYGITDISFAKYSILTFIFMLPGVSFFTIGAVGFTVENNKWIYFSVAIILAVLVSVAGLIIQKKYLGKEKEIDEISDFNEKKENAIIIFTRVPLPYMTKTRLMDFLSPDECASLHKAFIKDIYLECSKVNADIMVFFTPKDNDKILNEIIGNKAKFYCQEGENIWQRMEMSFNKVFEDKYKNVVLIGTDIPEISSEILKKAFFDLHSCDAVINKSKDDGYYLIGFSLKNIFKIDLSVEANGEKNIFESTISKLKYQGLNVKCGIECDDVDQEEDLRNLWNRIKYNSYTSSKFTREYIQKNLLTKLKN